MKTAKSSSSGIIKQRCSSLWQIQQEVCLLEEQCWKTKYAMICRLLSTKDVLDDFLRYPVSFPHKSNEGKSITSNKRIKVKVVRNGAKFECWRCAASHDVILVVCIQHFMSQGSSFSIPWYSVTEKSNPKWNGKHSLSSGGSVKLCKTSPGMFHRRWRKNFSGHHQYHLLLFLLCGWREWERVFRWRNWRLR